LPMRLCLTRYPMGYESPVLVDANPSVPWAFCHFLLPYPESHLEN